MFFKRKPKLKYYIADQEFMDGKVLIVQETKWNKEFKSILKDNNASHIRFSWSAGWREENYSFLEELSDFGLEGLGINTYEKIDLSPVQDLKDLKKLSFNQGYYRNCPDFSEFKNLKCLQFDYQPTAKSLFECVNLSTLYVGRYPYPDLTPLKNMVKIKNLQIRGRKLETLVGIEALNNLEYLEIHYANKLEFLENIHLCPNLSAVVLYGCGRVEHNPKFFGRTLDHNR